MLPRLYCNVKYVTTSHQGLLTEELWCKDSNELGNIRQYFQVNIVKSRQI